MEGNGTEKKFAVIPFICLTLLGLTVAEGGALLTIQAVRFANANNQQGGSGGASPAQGTNYTVTWLNDDGTVLEVDNSVAPGATPTFDGTTPTKASQGLINYTFKGWNHEVAAVNEDTSYVATYTTSYDNATVTFNIGGHGTQIDPQSVAYNGYINKPTDPLAEGYKFVGWYKESSILIAWNFDSDKVTSNTTIYARWENAQDFTVTFETDHGDPVAPQVIPYGGKVTNPGAPQNYDSTKWYFEGWKDIYGHFWDFNNATVTNDLTLRGSWIGVK